MSQPFYRRTYFYSLGYTKNNEMIVGISNCAQINGAAGAMKADFHNEAEWYAS